MDIDLVLVHFQALFLSLYGVLGIVRPEGENRKQWIIAVVGFFAVTGTFVFLNVLNENIQSVLLLLLIADYLQRLFGINSLRWVRTALCSMIVLLSFALIYFYWQSLILLWLAPFALGLLYWISKRWDVRLAETRSYFLKAGAMLTLFFVLELVFISIQQNLKPIATIPVTLIINQQNMILLGAMLLLVLAGYVWKEKSSF